MCQFFLFEIAVLLLVKIEYVMMKTCLDTCYRYQNNKNNEPDCIVMARYVNTVSCDTNGRGWLKSLATGV